MLITYERKGLHVRGLHSVFLRHALIPLLVMLWHINTFLCQYLRELKRQLSCISAIPAQLADVKMYMRTVRLRNQNLLIIYIKRSPANIPVICLIEQVLTDMLYC